MVWLISLSGFTSLIIFQPTKGLLSWTQNVAVIVERLFKLCHSEDHDIAVNYIVNFLQKPT